MIYLVGDSHISFFVDGGYEAWCAAGGSTAMKSVDFPGGFRSLHLGPLLAYSFNLDREEYRWADDQIPADAKVLVVLGEIDCRRYLPSLAREQGNSIAWEAGKLARRFTLAVDVFRRESRRVAIWAPHASLCDGGERTEVWQDRVHAAVEYRNALDLCATATGVEVFGLHEAFFRQEWQTLLRCYTTDLCHLSQKAGMFVPDEFLEWRDSA